ncbi:MAG: tetratricopeptide repeat protein [Nostoc sp. DedQUE05]|uniref:tetratricopeptide repeat protein n=1 Tax=Nostoc sp. DedQUE05 TaxID=3075391 RepID=UPI002AD441EE|nr:tetratricopeptide repeat protein [Nostoc sp. DedQUE05]MDZ8091969.1 tetratricopeptide repeat protein [Nostoc sp. DedQUE05]
MQTLHLDLKQVDENYVELRYFIDNPNKYEKRSLCLTEVADLIKLAERDYYVSFFPEDYTVTGRRLYNWLDGSDRWLQPLLDKYRREGIVLAIAVTEKLAHLPWEVLHDGNSFLVQRVPAIVPVRWVSDSTVKKLTIDGEAENRALQVLFMATSPLNVEPVLDFEGEEARILEATKRQPLALTVEESGCLSELGYLVDGYDGDYFDVLHLTGHATLQDGQPRFITETATGEAFYASAGDIAQELQFRLPKLIFLSGCRTGQAGNGGSVPSMAEELLKSGAKAVLGWGQKVLDADATAAAAALYEELSAGKQIIEAVACTYQALIKNKARDWHLLRVYAAGNLPSSLVTPLRTRGRKPAPPLSVSTQFLDPAGKVKVPTRESFVGRRRQLQSCLRVLSQPSDEVGVLIHGMGGLGKSSLAARLCDRLPNFERVVWVGRIDEASLVNRLAEKLDDNEQRKSLQNYDEELRFRLRRVFQQLHEEAKPILLVLDDFEVNLELTSPPTPLRSGEGSQVPPFPRREGGLGGLGRLQTEAAEVMKAVVWAIRENFTSHRIIITCRYDFEFTQLQHFYKQPLDALQGADLQKKFSRLTAFSAKSQVDEALKFQAQKLADGNPRLLEWLDKLLAPHPLTPSPQARRGNDESVDVAAILNRLAADPVELREQVLAEALLEQMDTIMQEMLSRGLVFELPVPREALAAVCENIPNLEDYINRAVALGLLEVNHDEALRVPRILPLLLIQDKNLYNLAVKILNQIWRVETEGNLTEDKCIEIHRLALLGGEKNIAIETCSALAFFRQGLSLYRDAVNICQVTLEIFKDWSILNELARAEKQLGDTKNALYHYHKALKLCPLYNKKQRATILHNLSIIYIETGKQKQAIYFNKKSWKISQEINNYENLMMVSHGMAIIYTQQGKLDEAIEYYEKALEAANRIEEEVVVTQKPRYKAVCLNNIAYIHTLNGHFEAAISLYEKSIQVMEELGDIKNQAVTLNNIAQIYISQGLINQAVPFILQSLTLKESIGDLKGQSASLHNLAHIHIIQGQVDQGIALCEKALQISRQIHDTEGQGYSLMMLGQIVAIKRSFSVGMGYLHEAINIFQQLNSPHTKKVQAIIDYLLSTRL